MTARFIRDKLTLKLLILYILGKLAAPIDRDRLADLAMCDDGVDYFSFTEALFELVDTGHIVQEDELFSITPLGISNCKTCESSIPYPVRMRCDRNTDVANLALRREKLIRAELLPRDGNEYTIHMTMDDESGLVFGVDLLCADEKEGNKIAERFRRHPEDVYNAVLSVLLSEDAD